MLQAVHVPVPRARSRRSRPRRAGEAVAAGGPEAARRRDHDARARRRGDREREGRSRRPVRRRRPPRAEPRDARGGAARGGLDLRARRCVPVVDLLVETGLAKSKGDARRTITEGGAYLNNVRVEDPEAEPAPSRPDRRLVAGPAPGQEAVRGRRGRLRWTSSRRRRGAGTLARRPARRGASLDPSGRVDLRRGGRRRGHDDRRGGRAWRAVRFRPRVLRGVGEADLRTTLLGDAGRLADRRGADRDAARGPPQGERAMAAGACRRRLPPRGLLERRHPVRGPRRGDPGGSRPTCRPSATCCRPCSRRPSPQGARVVLTVDTPYPGTKYGVDDEDWTAIDLGWWRGNYPERRRRRLEGRPDPRRRRLAARRRRASRSWSRACCAATTPCAASTRAPTPSTSRTTEAASSTARVEHRDGAARGGRRGGGPGRGVRRRRDPLAAPTSLAALALGARGVFVGRPALWALRPRRCRRGRAAARRAQSRARRVLGAGRLRDAARGRATCSERAAGR